MGFQSSINSLALSIAGAAAAKKLDAAKAPAPAPQAKTEGPAADNKQLPKTTDWTNYKPQGLHWTTGQQPAPTFSAYNEDAFNYASQNMQKEIKAKFNQRSEFQKRLTASRKKIGGKK